MKDEQRESSNRLSEEIKELHALITFAEDEIEKEIYLKKLSKKQTEVNKLLDEVKKYNLNKKKHEYRIKPE